VKNVSLFLVGGLVGAIVGALWIGPERIGALSDEDAAAIDAAAVSQAEAAVAMDWAGFASFYAEDGLMMVPDFEAVGGREAILEMTSRSEVVDFYTVAQAIEGCSNIAYRRGNYTYTYPVPGADEPATDTGKFVEIWKRQPDGSWLLAVDIWNAGAAQAEKESGT